MSPRLIAFFAACLALISQIALAVAPPSAGAISAAGSPQIHICGVGQPSQTPDHKPHHSGAACPTCPLCNASVLHAFIISPTEATAVPPVAGTAPRSWCVRGFPPSMRRLSAAMPRGPPALT